MASKLKDWQMVEQRDRFSNARDQLQRFERFFTPDLKTNKNAKVHHLGFNEVSLPVNSKTNAQ
jgi:hypothetical protein